MKRILPRFVYSSIVGVVIVTMTVNPASGGWLLHKIRCHAAAKHHTACCEEASSCESVCEASPHVSHHEMSSSMESCCGSSMESMSEPMMPESSMMHMGDSVGCSGCGTSMMEGGTMMDGGMHMEGGTMMHGDMMMEPGMTMATPMIEDSGVPMTLDGSSVMDSMDAHEPSSSDAMPVTPSKAAEPKQATPTPDAEPVAPKTPVEPEPKPEPKPETAPADDIFGSESTPPPMPMPAAEPLDNLFDSTPAAPAATAPSEDLFSTPPTTEPAAPMEDLFNTSPTTEPAAPAAEDSIFGTGISQPATESLTNSRLRVWIDNTGEFSTEGRLVEIGADFVRLEKANGRTCTVPNSRLCAADANYVASISRSSNGVKVAMVSGR